jgi:hypothetical protein
VNDVQVSVTEETEISKNAKILIGLNTKRIKESNENIQIVSLFLPQVE